MNGYDFTQTNCSQFRTLIKLWHRFGVWRAMRKLRRIHWLREQAEVEMIEARMLLRRHSQDPQQSLNFGD